MLLDVVGSDRGDMRVMVMGADPGPGHWSLTSLDTHGQGHEGMWRLIRRPISTIIS